MSPRENENNAYANFWGDNERALWYVTVFSGVVNCGFLKTGFLVACSILICHFGGPFKYNDVTFFAGGGAGGVCSIKIYQSPSVR